MNLNSCLSPIDADDPWTSNLRSLRLEELVDASRAPGPWPAGLPGPTAGEAQLLPQAACVVAQVDDMAMAIVLRNAPAIAQSARTLDAGIGASPELAAMAARRLRRLMQAPWFVAQGENPTLTPAVKESLATLLARLDQARSPSSPAPRSATARFQDTPAARAGAEASSPRLSARELQVARYVALGMTNKQIAIALKLSPNTIKRHLARILRRLGMGKRAAVASWYAVQQRPGEPTPMGGDAPPLGAVPTSRASSPYPTLTLRAEPLRGAPLHQ